MARMGPETPPQVKVFCRQENIPSQEERVVAQSSAPGKALALGSHSPLPCRIIGAAEPCLTGSPSSKDSTVK
eukprot:7421807-Pyramimonas_sp.AAC.1